MTKLQAMDLAFAVEDMTAIVPWDDDLAAELDACRGARLYSRITENGQDYVGWAFDGVDRAGEPCTWGVLMPASGAIG